jgi:hypothetical protein
MDTPKAQLTPAAFALSALRIQLYPWQIETLTAVGKGIPTALLAPNGSGKSSTVLTALILWFLSEFPSGRAVITSGSWAQLKSQIFDSAKRFQYHPLFRGWEFLESAIKTSAGGSATGFSVDEAFKLEGHHQRSDSPLLLCIDEAKAVSDATFEAIDKCTPSFEIVVSSAGPAAGKLFRIFTSESQFWFRRKVTYRECPHLSESKRLIDLETYPAGEASTFYRNRWLSEFATDSGECLISLDAIRECVANPPEWKPGVISAFCDFAGAGDESALAVANGNKVDLIDHWRHRLTTVSTGRFLNWFRKLRLQSHQISGDQGFGYQIMDVMQESGYFLRRCNNNAPAIRSDVYCNQIAEWWDNFGILIGRKAVILPNNETLFSQLSDRRKEYDSRGRVKLEPKEAMRARGGSSPDLADAVIGACAQMMPGLGVSGAITSETLKGIKFGGGRALFPGTPVTFADRDDEPGVERIY